MARELSQELVQKIVERLAALADESRIRILLRLRSGECNVGQLAAELNLAQASASKHLAILRNVGLVESRRNGAQVICRVADQSIFELCSAICDVVVRHLQSQGALAAAQLDLSSSQGSNPGDVQ